jgi:hypothetical protein
VQARQLTAAIQFHTELNIQNARHYSLQADRDPSLSTVEQPVRLSALMPLYIPPLYILVSKILSFILNSPVSIHPLYHPLFTLSTVGPTCHFI